MEIRQHPVVERVKKKKQQTNRGDTKMCWGIYLWTASALKIARLLGFNISPPL